VLWIEAAGKIMMAGEMCRRRRVSVVLSVILLMSAFIDCIHARRIPVVNLSTYTFLPFHIYSLEPTFCFISLAYSVITNTTLITNASKVVYIDICKLIRQVAPRAVGFVSKPAVFTRTLLP